MLIEVAYHLDGLLLLKLGGGVDYVLFGLFGGYYEDWFVARL